MISLKIIIINNIFNNIFLFVIEFLFVIVFVCRQLGSSDGNFRSKPQENRWVTQLLNKLQCTGVSAIVAGGGHNMLLTGGAGQVISWGAGDYGQLGHGFAWDDARYCISFFLYFLINSIKNIL